MVQVMWWKRHLHRHWGVIVRLTSLSLQSIFIFVCAISLVFLLVGHKIVDGCVKLEKMMC